MILKMVILMQIIEAMMKLTIIMIIIIMVANTVSGGPVEAQVGYARVCVYIYIYIYICMCV